MVSATADGWLLSGSAVFGHETAPACINYSVIVDRSWKTRSGCIRGFVGNRPLERTFAHTPGGWEMDGVLVEGLSHLVDLDYGFTPATNLLQLRRLNMAPGNTARLSVAWFDMDSATLTELPQIYECISETDYRYAALTVGYQGQIELASRNGFVRTYPHLWVIEP
jgi:hypothetical protein